MSSYRRANTCEVSYHENARLNVESIFLMFFFLKVSLLLFKWCLCI